MKGLDFFNRNQWAEEFLMEERVLAVGDLKEAGRHKIAPFQALPLIDLCGTLRGFLQIGPEPLLGSLFDYRAIIDLVFGKIRQIGQVAFGQPAVLQQSIRADQVDVAQ